MALLAVTVLSGRGSRLQAIRELVNGLPPAKDRMIQRMVEGLPGYVGSVFDRLPDAGVPELEQITLECQALICAIEIMTAAEWKAIRDHCPTLFPVGIAESESALVAAPPVVPNGFEWLAPLLTFSE